MRIVSVVENQKIEKRIAITPEVAKKYISLGFEVSLPENYGFHLGIKDAKYEEFGVKISKDEKEILINADIIVQLGLLSDEKNLLIKENQTFIGVLNPHENKEKIDNLVKKKKAIYDLRVDKKTNKVGNGLILDNFEIEKLPNYIKNNYNKYKDWID